MIDFRRHWTEDWARLNLTGTEAWLDRVLASHAEPSRHYHTLQHLEECLALFDQVAHLAEHPGEVAIALWFHDAVYVPLATDNEARSAAWASEALRTAGAPPALIERIQALVMATVHHDATADADAGLVIDIDLAILGAGPARFAQYEQQVRAEYAAVPAFPYRRKRNEILARLLARPVIYGTPDMHRRFEAQARMNLRHAIGR
ncbi:N-methyl-D-aspartate receptor NMDAR2C subunit [Massilia sp. MS-15]|uniref:HD domain-containing protein n=1 Tax=Massilia sp. MS-15 TaxID=2878200 RepID=UPI001CD63883|nr:N-methyl-D-aspartate receptor NMDAR2C subunit [Massilia sp. MS-15]MCA1248615.1 N-methyl-D-aspartate receptor NMDAR2C subunit [Massilia sp. MS-15]